ncbi:MAG: PKD domain-containing protein, partial [Nonlabens sp.]|nr:PKD domain-containing protein [Nonlabens sp.]
MEVLRFDNSTGVLSNPIRIAGFNQPRGTTARVYGVEFSPNSNYLYISEGIYGIQQFNVSQHNFNSINNSRSYVHTNSIITPTPTEEFATLQLGPDGKIYVAHFNSVNLGTIEFPNLSGLACNYQFGTITLASGTKSYSGLPPFITTIFAPAITVENTCLGDVTTFQLDANQAIGSASWDFGDGTTSSQLNPSHTYAASGDYTVSVNVTSSGGIATTSTIVSINEVPVATAPQDVLVCDVNNDGIAVFDLTMQDVSILNGQSTTTFEVVYFESLIAYGNNNPIANPTNYSNTTAYTAQSIVASVRNRNNSLCEANTTFNIRVFDTPMPQLTIPTIAICDNDSVGSDTDGLALFDLTSNEAIILNGQSPTDFEIIYYSDAALSAVILNPTAYQNVNRIETIY